MSYNYDPPERGRGGRSSKASRDTFHEQVAPTLSHRQQEFYDVVCAHPGGMTAKEVAVELKRPLHTISGRPSELIRAGLIRGTGVRRDDSEVLVLVTKAEQQDLFAGAA